jgi:hypothetical protein
MRGRHRHVAAIIARRDTMKMSHTTRTAALAGLLAAGLFSARAYADSLMFHAKLDAATEVPPKNSKGTGMLMATLDTKTKMLSYEITYSGLTGPATMAHFHGPALPGANAGIAVMFKDPSSGAKATVPLTDAQIADLEAGKWYVNVHTAANPGGEIRGQVTQMK